MIMMERRPHERATETHVHGIRTHNTRYTCNRAWSLICPEGLDEIRT
jgi:hypothetical protein